MPRVTRTQNDPKTCWAGRHFVALIVSAVVLLIIFAFIGIGQASRLGAAGPQLPPAKATLLAKGDATLAAARARSAGHPKQLYPTPAAVPTETF
ncbi:MAG TPA: hypothetical protein VFS83_20460, partial [Ktedonobacterales bacterium]|nr:hypothetical protein [Ktedonobacterales bacterium]